MPIQRRNYKKEYISYYGMGKSSEVSPLKRLRRKQKASRAKALKLVRSKKKIPKNHDVHHKDGNPLNNALSNLSVISRKKNRSMKKKKKKKK